MKRPLLIALTALVLLPGLHAGELPLPVTEPGQAYSRSPVWISHAGSSRVAIGTESPFGLEEKDRALHVRNDLENESPFRFRARLWDGADAAPFKGVVEVPLQLVKGAVQVHVATSTQGFTPQVSSVLVEQKQVQCRVSLEVGKPPLIIVGGKLEKDPAALPTEAGRILLKMEWDYTPGQTPFFRLSLNGEGISSPEPTAEMLALGGVNVLSITALKGAEPSEFFIGPITFTE